jgi:hypothetical protein
MEISIENQPVLTLLLPSNLSKMDQEELFVELRKAGGVVQQETRRDLANIVLVLTAVKLSAEIVKVTIDLADKIIAMRKNGENKESEPCLPWQPNACKQGQSCHTKTL